MLSREVTCKVKVRDMAGDMLRMRKVLFLSQASWRNDECWGSSRIVARLIGHSSSFARYMYRDFASKSLF
jgi:hypothetical protein